MIKSILSLCLLFSFHSQGSEILRVRLIHNQKEILVMGTDVVLTTMEKGPQVFANKKSVRIKKDPSGKNLGLLATVKSPSGLLTWKGDLYKGSFEIMATPKGLELIHLTDIEDYLGTLLAKEMNGNWPLEALKAQAVAARTYALAMMKNRKLRSKKIFNYDLENSEKNQVSGHLLDQTKSTRQAALMTKGLVLRDKSGTFVPTFYHAKCGGQTFIPEDVWENPMVGHESVPCQFCAPLGSAGWQYQMGVGKFRGLLEQLLDGRARFLQKSKVWGPEKFIVKKDRKGFPKLEISYRGQDLELNKSYIRRFLGTEKIPSNNFKIFQKGSNIQFQGEGLGHGVGMCQLGALEMAKRGWSYEKILAYYYPGLALKKY